MVLVSSSSTIMHNFQEAEKLMRVHQPVSLNQLEGNRIYNNKLQKGYFVFVAINTLSILTFPLPNYCKNLLGYERQDISESVNSHTDKRYVCQHIPHIRKKTIVSLSLLISDQGVSLYLTIPRLSNKIATLIELSFEQK